MFSKAMTFEDFDTARKIMSETSPSKIKALGRQVKNFNDDIWCRVREDVAYTGLLAKYSQNEKLKTAILQTGNREIVEASPRDRIWGIGLGENDEHIEDKTKWKGGNILGKVLMRVRDHIMSETTASNLMTVAN
jgi:ribA/ribD-fused uncharacterized protein